MKVVRWRDFATSAGDLASHVVDRLGGGKVCYLATVRSDGWPRVHPVGVHFRGEQMVVVMYPSSPKGRDITSNGRYAVHGTVEDNQGGKGEVMVIGTARPTEATADDVERGWIAFELLLGEVLAVRYEGEDLHPVSNRWRAP